MFLDVVIGLMSDFYFWANRFLCCFISLFMFLLLLENEKEFQCISDSLDMLDEVG